ncbi:MAG: DNA methyltransferase [Desulfobacterales bacterium]
MKAVMKMYADETNEERRSGAYLGDYPPTVPSAVMPYTPLQTLNLNWREKDLPEKIRTKHVHRLHPYLGKFIPQLAEIFLRKYFSPGQTVLDPFCGSGTTLVQANELGINSIGYDISAFNVLLCRAKTGCYDPAKAKSEISDILERVRRDTQRNLWNLNLDDSEYREADNEYLQTWFAPKALNELLTYRNYIDSVDYEYKDLLKVILSRSARSARLVTHFDLDFPKKPQTTPYHCYKHSRICHPTEEAFKFLNRYSIDTIKRITGFSKLRTKATVEVCHADSRDGKFPHINGVITSPPYVGLIDYHEQHIYAYHLLGLEDKRTREIGAAANGSSQKAKQSYQQDLAEVFRHAFDAMESGGRFIIIAGDKYKLYDEIAKLAGVEVEDVIQRHVNRRTGRRSTEFYESIFVWRKP